MQQAEYRRLNRRERLDALQALDTIRAIVAAGLPVDLAIEEQDGMRRITRICARTEDWRWAHRAVLMQREISC
jgi:hypothetical protein